jgi:dephospho-CoA kinase
MKKNKLVCVSGMPGAGKSVVSDYFADHGYQFVRFGQVVLDHFVKSGEKPTEAKEKKIREELRKKHGMAAIAIKLYPKFKLMLKKGNVIADGLYSFSEYEYLKERFGDQMIVVAVFSPPKTRYERISKRKSGKRDKNLRHRPFTKEEAKSRDYAEIKNLEKGGPIAMADYTIVNDGSYPKFKKQIINIFTTIQEL